VPPDANDSTVTPRGMSVEAAVTTTPAGLAPDSLLLVSSLTTRAAASVVLYDLTPYSPPTTGDRPYWKSVAMVQTAFRRRLALLKAAS